MQTDGIVAIQTLMLLSPPLLQEAVAAQFRLQQEAEARRKAEEEARRAAEEAALAARIAQAKQVRHCPKA